MAWRHACPASASLPEGNWPGSLLLGGQPFLEPRGPADVGLPGGQHPAAQRPPEVSRQREREETRPGVVAVRDSKDRGGPQLAVSDRAWSEFVQGIKQGEYDLG